MADPSTQATRDAQRQQALQETAAVAELVRRAVVASLPVAPEQYLTLSLPGTVVDIDDIANGGTYVYDATTNPFTPTAVRQAEAKLVDGLMPLGSIMLGNTGKSVSRSYASALDYLVAKKATVKTGKNNIRSPGDQSYDDAMKALTKQDPISGKTPVQVYIEKQTAWAVAQDAWDTAKITARQDAEAKWPNNNTAAVQEYNDWSQSHYRRFKEETQARWMDWVCEGDKYNVEYNFGLVDVDSIMARIESSKQSMRNSTIVDADGANELQEVNLNPKNWASLCKTKVEGFRQNKSAYTQDQVNSEILRLSEFETSLKALLAEVKKSPPGYPKSNPGPKPDGDIATAQTALNDAYTALYDAQAKVNSGDTSVDSATLDKLRSDLNAKIKAWENASAALVKWELSQPGDNAQATIQSLIDKVENQLTGLKGKLSSGSSIVAIVNAHGSAPQGDAKADPKATSGNDMATENAYLAEPIFGLAPPDNTPPQPPLDAWTKITYSFSATDQKTHMDQSSWGFSAGASVGFGLFSAGGAYSHEESSENFRFAMSNCDISLNFSVMVVNIDRPWLYAELFNDYEIDIAADAQLSPGPDRLHQWMDAKDISLAMYNVFPAFPTSFIVACNTEIEFLGNTTDIETHFRSVSNSASASVGWGPFSANASFHSQSSSSDFHGETTATGYKITFAAPQIIAWVSQILPALPRDPSFQPLLQRNV